jgi:hypothetical protein
MREVQLAGRVEDLGHRQRQGSDPIDSYLAPLGNRVADLGPELDCAVVRLC